MLNYNITSPDGFSIQWDEAVIVTEFSGFEISPVNLTKVVASLRNAVEYRSHERWAQALIIGDGKKIKSNLRNILLKEFDWEFKKNCVACAICVPSDDISMIRTILKSGKLKERINVFDKEDKSSMQDWLKSMLNLDATESIPEKVAV